MKPNEEGLDSTWRLSISQLRKIILQVITQTEASNENGKVGIARTEPNRSFAAI